MSDRKGRKPSQTANKAKAKQAMKDQDQRTERDVDRLADDARRDMDRLGDGMKREGQRARSDMDDRTKEMKRKLQHH
ncbi:hypothetical protein ACQP1O_13525 [Nocardia sp. CA-151230]|uniref:hypothetical protein n=1 Tax=Nocardia sp. CA-151230 TaxID=3239982 RepID=UPI003D8B11E1